MICFHKWRYLTRTDRVCFKCGRREKEVWVDTAFTGNIPEWRSFTGDE